MDETERRDPTALVLDADEVKERLLLDVGGDLCDDDTLDDGDPGEGQVGALVARMGTARETGAGGGGG